MKYWREVVIYTLNCVQVKKDTQSTPFELWYGYPPNVKYFKILKENAIFLKMIGMESFMKKVMKAYSLDTPQEVKLTSV